MAKILLFQSNRTYGSLEEYVVIVGDESIPIKDYMRPGFEHTATADIFDDVSLWPTDRALVAEE